MKREIERDKNREKFLRVLRKEFEDNNTELNEKDVEFALFGFEMGLSVNKEKNNGKDI